MNKLVKINAKNIYPFSRENFDALIGFYFIKNGITRIGVRNESSNTDILNSIYEKALQIDLYEFEFILNCIIENIYLFESNVGIYRTISKRESLTIENLCRYGLDTYLCETTVHFSSSRKKVTQLFSKALIKSSKDEHIQSL